MGGYETAHVDDWNTDMGSLKTSYAVLVVLAGKPVFGDFFDGARSTTNAQRGFGVLSNLFGIGPIALIHVDTAYESQEGNAHRAKQDSLFHYQPLTK